MCSRMANVTILPAQDNNRAQMIVKKINANGRIVVVNQTVQAQAQLATINKVQQNTAASSAAHRGGPR